MVNPKVTVVTPSFNQAAFLEETIKSVLSQTYRNIEYIIIDGASTDGTAAILSKYADRVDVIVSERDEGQADAINKGLAMASGDFMTWLNSDDLLERDAIEKCIAALKRYPEAGFVYGSVNVIDESSRFLRVLRGRQVSPPFLFFDLEVPIPQQGVVWRREVTDACGLLDSQWHYVLDREFFLRMCLKFDARFIDQILGSFRLHGKSKSISMGDAWVLELPAMYAKLTSSASWLALMDKKITRKTRASAHVNAAYLALWRGSLITGISELARAFYAYPAIFFCSHIYSKPIVKIRSFVQGHGVTRGE